MKPHEKAYKIDLSRIDEGYLWSPEIVYAKNRNKAKSLLLPEFDGAFHNDTGEEITYLNIPVVRHKAYDKFLVEGILMTAKEIEYQRKINERDAEFDKLLKNNPNGKAYIMKGGYYWCSGRSGYTEIKHLAGVYELSEAISICKSSDLSRYERPILIDKEAHNDMINKLIKKLTKQLIL